MDSAACARLCCCSSSGDLEKINGHFLGLLNVEHSRLTSVHVGHDRVCQLRTIFMYIAAYICVIFYKHNKQK